MTDEQGSDEQTGRKRLKNVVDFREEIGNVGEHKVGSELNLPNIDAILKDLQRKHGVRISLSPDLIARLDQIKVTRASDPTLRVGCFPSDICVLCDQADYCSTCDALDFCYSVDTHFQLK